MARASATEITQSLATTNWAYVSLHTADPGTTGASEVTGGTYARVAVTWTASSAGSPATNAGALTINVPASTTVAYFGIWSAITAGTYMIGGALASSVTTGSSAGQITIAIAGISISSS